MSKKLYATITRVSPHNKYINHNATFVVDNISQSLTDFYLDRPKLLGHLMADNWNSINSNAAHWFTAYIHKRPEVVDQLYKDDKDVYMFAEVTETGKNKYTWAFIFVADKFSYDKMSQKAHEHQV